MRSLMSRMKVVVGVVVALLSLVCKWEVWYLRERWDNIYDAVG